MATQDRDIFALLAAPFGHDEIKTRDGGFGRTLSYITVRTVLDRLDSAVGPANWRNRTRVEKLPNGDNAVVCTIEIRVDGEWVAKEDAGGFKEMTMKVKGQDVHDAENTVKTGWTDAFKRAAVLWSVGRDLSVCEEGAYPGEARVGGYVPEPAREPQRQAPPQRQPAPAPQNGNGDRPAYNGPQRAPTSGKALFAWTKEMEQKHEVGLLRYLNEWSKLHDFPGRMIDWDGEQVGLAYAEANRKLASVGATAPAAPAPAPARAAVPADRGDAYEGDGGEDVPF